jgi:hypothetical protein
MKVSVYHTKFNELTGLKEGMELVAEITFEDGTDVNDALNKSWRQTNNVKGSWSMGPYFDVPESKWSENPEGYERNGDYFPNVEVKRPLWHDGRNGKIYGLRSSMFGDIFVIDDKEAHEVTMMGFKLVDLARVTEAPLKVGETVDFEFEIFGEIKLQTAVVREIKRFEGIVVQYDIQHFRTIAEYTMVPHNELIKNGGFVRRGKERIEVNV